MIRLAVIDDHPAIAAALEAAIRGRDDLELVGSATTTAAAIDLVGHLAPDIVICDLWLDGEPGGLDVLAALTASERRGVPRVLVLSGF
ncbi:MAG TPA: response regulator, partial [Candidatus Acidoferrum sp.]|nr:response regulator [Candidatus Acidoferrum sp.]